MGKTEREPFSGPEAPIRRKKLAITGIVSGIIGSLLLIARLNLDKPTPLSPRQEPILAKTPTSEPIPASVANEENSDLPYILLAGSIALNLIIWPAVIKRLNKNKLGQNAQQILEEDYQGPDAKSRQFFP